MLIMLAPAARRRHAGGCLVCNRHLHIGVRCIEHQCIILANIASCQSCFLQIPNTSPCLLLLPQLFTRPLAQRPSRVLGQAASEGHGKKKRTWTGQNNGGIRRGTLQTKSR